MSRERNTILSPRRSSAVTHGHFAVDKSGSLYFKYDHCLSPTLVYGAMLRLEQVDWLDRFKTIFCEATEDMWELRKRLPGFADIIGQDYEPSVDPRPVLVVANKFDIMYVEWDEEAEDYDAIVEVHELWPVSTPTSNYVRTTERS